MTEPTRREFVVMTCACCAVLCVDAQANETSSSNTVDLGPIVDFKPEGVYDQFAKSNKLLVLSTGKRIAVATARCTHKNCVLKVKDEQLYCPCHKSTFDNDGIPITGKAKASLHRYGVSVENDHLIVDLSKEFEEAKWDDEGAFVNLEI